MLKILKYGQSNSSSRLEIFLNKRKLVQKNKTIAVKKIIDNVRKKGDEAVISYEKKFSKIKTNSKRVFFSNKEINKISKKTDKIIKQAINLAYE